ncbi:hypothetical protein H0H87_002163 [Tephrocybe sp. NHM501043]|nr:hypothetical protein H0H87_002163 [Tephrocybe sp. NHM501043]
MESLWSTDSDETVPPFPERPAIQMVPMLLDDRCMLHPFGRGKQGPDEFKVLTSIPTPPRMKNLLLEPLCIDKWVETIYMRAPPPNHIAWQPAVAKECSWVASGSLFSPGDFKRALHIARSDSRNAFAPFAMFNSVLSRTNGRRSSGSNRKALVFEREITLNAEGQAKRWSLQIPAETMNPEMVDIMLELQDLNSYFKNSLAGLDESVAVIEKEKSKLSSEPPALMVSDSHRSFPLYNNPPEQFEASQRIASVPPVPIAARRGRSLLPPLAITPKVEKDPYPSIPTAFLGSPSAYSPKFEGVVAGDGPSLNLEHMVANLRSQCALPQAVDEASPQSPGFSPLSEISFAAPSDQDNSSDDDWAFAVSFLDGYGNNTAVINADQTEPPFYQKSKPGEDVVPKSSNELLTPRVRSAALSPSPVPSMPLPPLPTSMLRDPSVISSSPRGILKSSKNVRFASLPEKSVTSDEVDEDPSSTPPSTTSSMRAPKAPSRIHAYTRPLTLASPLNLPQGVSVANKKNQILGGNRPVTSENSQHGRPNTFVVHRSPPRPQSVATLARRPTPISIGRQSLRRLESHENQETRDTLASPRLRWTMNDMSFKRGSGSSLVSSDGASKGRKRAPLRNILTRFK